MSGAPDTDDRPFAVPPVALPLSDGTSPLCFNSSAADRDAVETTKDSSHFVTVQARAGNITPRYASSTEPIPCAGMSPFRPGQQPQQNPLAGAESGSSHTDPSAKKFGSFLGAPGSKRSSLRGSPVPPSSIIAYVQGNPGGDAEGERGAAAAAAVTVEFDEGSVEAQRADYQQSRRPPSSILPHTRTSLRRDSRGGGSSANTPQLMYRQECAEDVARMSPVASAATSPSTTPRERSRVASIVGGGTGGPFFPILQEAPCGAGAAAGGEGDSRDPSHGNNNMSGGNVAGVSTPEMAEYFSDQAVHTAANYPAEKSVSSTFVVQKCLKTIKEQAKAIQQLQHEMLVLSSRNRLLEERVQRLEVASFSHEMGGRTREGVLGGAEGEVAGHAGALRGDEPNEGGEAHAGDAFTSSGSPSVPRPSGSLENACATREPSKALPH